MIDGDNAQAALLPQMLDEVSKYGVMKIRRVYGDWSSSHLNSWKSLLHTYGLKPEQQFSYTNGKNAIDIALIIDAMDFINNAGVDGICIVSSDSDYTPLATRIREKNFFVMGIGRSTTSPAFVSACDVFVCTDDLGSHEDAVTPAKPLPVSKPEKKTPPPAKSKDPFEKLSRSAFDATPQDDGWANLGAFGSSLKQLDPAFDPKTYGHKQLSQLIQARPDFFKVQQRASKSGNESIYIQLKKG